MNFSNAPKGTYVKRERNEVIYGKKNSSPLVLFLIPFTLLWGGGSLGGIYGMQIASGKFELIPTLFGIPFLIGSFFLTRAIIRMLFGKTELRVSNMGGVLQTGALLKKELRFRWSEISMEEENLFKNSQLLEKVKSEETKALFADKKDIVIKCRGEVIKEFQYVFSTKSSFVKDAFIENYKKYNTNRFN